MNRKMKIPHYIPLMGCKYKNLFNYLKDRDGTIKGELTISVSICLLSSQCQHLQSANEIIIYGNSGSLIGWINFRTFTCTGNIAICWEPDPPPPRHPRQRSPVFKFTMSQTKTMLQIRWGNRDNFSYCAI